MIRRIIALALLLATLSSAAQAQGSAASNRVGPGVTSGAVSDPAITFTGTPTSGMNFTLYQSASYIDGVFSADLAASNDTFQDVGGVVTLNLGGVTRALGAFSLVPFPAITSFSAPSLTSTSGSLTLAPTLTSLSLPVLKNVTAGFTGTAGVTSLSLPALTVVGGSFNPTTASLTTLSLPALTNVGSSFNPIMAALTSLSLPALTTVSNAFTPTMAALTTLSLPVLALVGGNFIPVSMTLVTSVSLPALVTTGSFNPIFAGATTLSLPALAAVTGTFSPTLAVLTTLSLPAIVSISGASTITAVNMTTFSFGTTLKTLGGNFSLAGAKLTQASVDGILVRLAALDGTNGTTAYSSKTITLTGGTNSTPSATGLAAKATLVARSCTVNNN